MNVLAPSDSLLFPNGMNEADDSITSQLEETPIPLVHDKLLAVYP